MQTVETDSIRLQNKVVLPISESDLMVLNIILLSGIENKAKGTKVELKKIKILWEK